MVEQRIIGVLKDACLVESANPQMKAFRRRAQATLGMLGLKIKEKSLISIVRGVVSEASSRAARGGRP